MPYNFVSVHNPVNITSVDFLMYINKPSYNFIKLSYKVFIILLRDKPNQH